MSRPFFICLLLITSSLTLAQEYAPVEDYLIDSLDLSAISDKDRALIDSSLTVFDACEEVVCQVAAISTIVEASWDINVWPKYNRWLYEYTQEQLEGDLSADARQQLQIANVGSLNNIGYLFNALGEVDSALYYYEICIDRQEEIGDKAGMSGTLINTGYIFLNQGFIEKALEFYYKSLRIEEELENQLGVATAQNAIGFVLYKQEETAQALDFYNKSLTIRRELKDDYGVATSLNNIGLVYRDNQEWEKALANFQECKTIEAKLGDKNGVSISLANIGLVYEGLGLLNEARASHEESLGIRRQLGDKLGISNSLNSIADIDLTNGKLKAARKNAEQSLKLAQELNYPRFIRDAASTLSRIAQAEGKWQEAMAHYRLYVEMKDTVFNEETLTSSIHQQYKYSYEKRALADSIKNANELFMQEAENARLNALATKRRQQTYFLAFGTLVILIFAFVLYNRMKTIKRQKLTIEDQNQELEIQKSDLSHFAHTVSHDLKSPINGIIGMMNLVDYEHEDLDPELKEKLDLIRGSAEKSTALISGILAYSEAGMKEREVSDVDVKGTIDDLVEGLKGPKEILFEYPKNLPIIRTNATQFKQVLANLFSNAVKYNHREPGQGKVKLTHIQEGNQHTFEVSDNGPGIAKKYQKGVFDVFAKGGNTNGQIDSTGIGLSIVKKLVLRNGGQIELQSEEGKGSTFKFTWSGQ